MSTGKGDLEAAFQAFDLQVLPGDTVRTARKDYSHRWKPRYPARASLRLAFFVIQGIQEDASSPLGRSEESGMPVQLGTFKESALPQRGRCEICLRSVRYNTQAPTAGAVW
jgi:hypothetical protein